MDPRCFLRENGCVDAYAAVRRTLPFDAFGQSATLPQPLCTQARWNVLWDAIVVRTRDRSRVGPDAAGESPHTPGRESWPLGRRIPILDASYERNHRAPRIEASASSF